MARARAHRMHDVPMLGIVMRGPRGNGRRLRLAAAWAVAGSITGPLLAGQAAAAGGTVGADVPVTAVDSRRGDTARNSPALAGDPTDSRFIVAANRVDGPVYGCELQLSGDGGRSWVAGHPVTVLPPGAEQCYAPEVAFDGSGDLYYLFVGLAGPGHHPMGVFLTTSSDRGGSFSPPRRVLGADALQVRMGVDPSSGAHGRIHLAWLRAVAPLSLGGLPPAPNPILAAFSDDGGSTFSAPVQVSDPRRSRVVAPALALGPGGAVHVLYYDLGADAVDYQGLEGAPYEGPWSLVLASSTDGGVSFGPGFVVDADLTPPERVMLIFTMPPAALAADQHGRVFVAWYDGRNGDWDVFLRSSSDRGRSWSRPRRLNDDPQHDGRHQYLPELAVSPSGRLDAVFYDRRNDPGNLRNDVYYCSSTDGGSSFSANLRLTSEGSSSVIGQVYAVPSARGLVEFGSRLGLLSRDDLALAAWTDTRNSAGGPVARPGYIEQAIFANRVEFPAETGHAGRWMIGLSALLVLVGVVAALGVRGVRRTA